MKEFPVGSVCFIVEGYPEYKGKECTIVNGFGKHKFESSKTGDIGEQEGYIVTIQGFGDETFVAKHTDLKLKRFPPNVTSWLNEKMHKLISPNPFIVLEDA